MDNALKLLGTDYIDVLTFRGGVGPDSNGVTLEETAKGMKVQALIFYHRTYEFGLICNVEAKQYGQK